MKKLILFILALAMAATGVQGAQMCPATGRVVDEQGQAVEYATVVLLKGTNQVAGMATDNEGRFELKVPTGEYTLSVQYLGLDPVKQAVRVEQQNDLGEIVMKSSATAIEGVVVKAQLIRREADRFVVDVANSTAALGKNGIELLETAPGIWVDGEKISINGKTGSKVFVNERELKYEPEQLLTYLRSLKADDIQKIEVVPTVGADYDADSAGGVIKITLKKRREDGIEGSISLDSRQSNLIHTYSPSGDINFHSGKLDLYASGWGWLGKNSFISNEHTSYTSSDSELRAHSKLENNSYNGGGTLGMVYELNDRNSIGGEFSFLHTGDPTLNDSYTDLTSAGVLTHTESRYTGQERANGYEATFNYIRKIDTLGSTFKIIGDYAYRKTAINNDNITRTTTPEPADSLYRDNTQSSYSVGVLTLALEKNFSPRWTLKAGAKYTRNDMNNDARYEYLQEQTWLPNENQSFRLDYSENIAAAYGIVSAKLGRWSFVAGLRGEYTHTEGKGDIKQDYFSLFPNANISYALSKDGAYSLIVQYARTISRPRFWTMTPRRMQISDYTYQIGNPRLEPAYTHDVSATLVFNHKYTLTGGVRIRMNEIQETFLADPENPDLLYLTWMNFDTSKSYYLSANLPFQLAKWWTLNLAANYSRNEQRMDTHSEAIASNHFQGRISTTVTLPRKFYIDYSYGYMSKMRFGSVWASSQNRMSITLKKRFAEKATVWFGVDNLLDQGQTITAEGSGFVRSVSITQSWTNRTYKIGASFNFKSGKAFKRKAVEAGASDDKGRM